MKTKRLTIATMLLLTINGNAQGWGQTQKTVPDDREINDQFGWSVAIDVNTAIISAKNKHVLSSSGGAVYVYTKDTGNSWNQVQSLHNSDQHQFDSFGMSVDIDNDFMIIGARGQDYDENGNNFVNAAGAVYIFEKDGSGNWNEVQKLVASDRGSFQPVLGETVAISGDYAVAVAPREEKGLSGQPNLSNSGAAYIYERDGTGTWSEVQKIVSSDRDVSERFGEFAIDIFGDYIAVGVLREGLDASGANELGNAGAVYIFNRDTNGVWNEVQKVVTSDREIGDAFGRSVSMDGDYLVIGADYEDTQADAAGAVYIFKKDTNGVFNEMQKIVASNGDVNDRFGFSAAIDGNKIIVGVPFKDYIIGGTTYAAGGAAYVFERDNAENWSQVQYSYGLDRAENDHFGYHVAISGDFAFAGAYQEDEDETGVNTLNLAGSAYIFDASETNTITLSVDDVKPEKPFVVYPNPTNENINIILGNIYSNVKVTLYNSLGQNLVRKTYNSVNTIHLKIAQPRGLYFVNVETEGISKTFKLMKR